MDKDRVKYIMNKNGCNEQDMFLFYTPAELERQFYKYIKFHFKKGVYLNMTKAREYLSYCAERGYIKNLMWQS